MKPAQCVGCPWEVRGQGYVPGSGPPQAHLIILGHRPGRDEVAMGKPFVGPAGRRLDLELTKAGIPRHLCWLDNCVRCWIKERNKDVVPQRAIEECAKRHWLAPLKQQLAGGAWGIVTLGSAASKYLCGEWAGERAAGSLVEVDLDYTD